MPFTPVGYKHHLVWVFVLLRDAARVLAGLPNLDQDGGEGEALLTIKVVNGEGDREAMSTGLPILLKHFVYKHYKYPLIKIYMRGRECVRCCRLEGSNWTRELELVSS